MPVIPRIRTYTPSKRIVWILYCMFNIGCFAFIATMSNQRMKELDTKAIYKCLDGIKYEVKNGKELHIQLTNNGQTFKC